MKNNEKPDFGACTRKAYELLLFQEKIQFPVFVEKLSFGRKILFDTMEHYCQITGLPLSEMTGRGKMQDGYTLKLPSLALILYSGGEENRCRRNWTLAHEVGHICLGHESDGEREEIEAHWFASELLMPRVLMEELWKEKECLSTKMVAEVFGVSFSAAEKRLQLWERRSRKSQRKELSPAELQLEKKVLDVYRPAFCEKLGVTCSAPEVGFSQAEEDWLYGFL